MKKKTVITTETREVWVIHQPSSPVDPLSSNTNEDSIDSGLATTLDPSSDAIRDPFKTSITREEQE